MQAFKTITGVMAYLPISNIDTDMIIPKQYLKTIKRTGLGSYLFAEMRYDETNKPKTDFILNQPDFKNAKILLTEENFGCGSSREHAVWSLIDFGITVVIAPSFADIFYSNCFKNGMLPITLSKADIQQLIAQKNNLVTVNLEDQLIRVESLEIPFSIDAWRRETLLKGLDEIGETLSYEKEITAFETKQKNDQPWLFQGVGHHA
ncbi:TPA: 3-isopropylmalate dehydratase small subunit [Legionella pneumophila]|nr:3-isopropylmalate dehydratase small subunit [Legionella pneumophila]